MILVHGACPKGADKYAERWAQAMISNGFHIDVERYPANWERHKGSAGYRRNAEMVKRGADICLAFIYGNSNGASHTLKLAQEADIRWEKFSICSNVTRSEKPWSCPCHRESNEVS